jgi:predicted dehydrogenase
VPEVALPDGSSFRSDAPDSYHTLLEFECGLMALVQCTPVSWQAKAGRLEVHGDAGSLLLDGTSPAIKVAGPGAPGYEDLPVPAHLANQVVPEGVYAPVFILIGRFLKAITGGEPMSPSFEDGYRTQELIEAVIRSDQTGERQMLPPG